VSPPRGGKREGAGRPLGSTTTEGWISRSIAFRPSLLARIDAAAQRDGLSRGQWIAQAAERLLSGEAQDSL